MEKLFIYLLFFCYFLPTSFGQTKFDQKKINQLFWKGEYQEILPDLQLLYNQDRNDLDINFKLGTSILFEADSTYKLEKAYGHLTYASASNEALAEYHFYYGRCLHFLGDYEKAIDQFEKYNEKKNKSTIELPVDEYITYCKNGKNLNKIGTADFKKISSVKFDLNSIGKSYSLEKIEKANQFNLNSELQTKVDKKYNHIPLLYYNEDLNMRFFSSYGEKDLGNKDIYMRIGSGENKKIIKLSDEINTNLDEDYPVYDEITGYLFFSSKGHNSIGGYDLFRAEFDSITSNFKNVENLGIGYSTPYDDYLFIVNSKKKLAYMSSSKLSKKNDYSIFFGFADFYEKLTAKNQSILTRFVNQINPNIKIKEIEITDIYTNKKIGSFGTNDKGEVILELPPGDYHYKMKLVGSSNDFEANLTIPESNNQILQEIEYSIDAKNDEKIIIRETYNDERNEIIAKNLTKEDELNKAEDKKLQLNFDKTIEREALVKLDMDGFSQNEVIDKVSDKIIEIELTQKENQQLINNLNAVIINNRSYYNQLQQEIDSIEKLLPQISKIERIEKLTALRNLRNEQIEVKEQTIWMQNINDSLFNLNSDNNPIKRNFEEISKLGDEITNLIQENKYEEAYQNILLKHREIQSLSVTSAHEKIYNDLLENQLEQARTEKKIFTLSSELNNLTEQKKNLQIEISNSGKKDKIKFEEELKTIDQKIISNQKQSKKLKTDLEELKILSQDLELKRNVITSVLKENVEDPVIYSEAKVNYFDKNFKEGENNKYDEEIASLKQNLSETENKLIQINETYQIQKDSIIDEESNIEGLLTIEINQKNELNKLKEEILSKNNSTDNSTIILENYINEKIQEIDLIIAQLKESQNGNENENENENGYSNLANQSNSNENNATNSNLKNQTQNSEIKNSSENESESENSNLANQSNSNENNATNSNLKNQTQNSEIKNSSENENESENSNFANQSNFNENIATNSNLKNQSQNSEIKNSSENESENSNFANQSNSNGNNGNNPNLKNQTQNSENKKESENENENESENSNLANQSNFNENNATNSNLKNQTQNSENKKENENENESENSNLANQSNLNEKNATNSNLKNQTQNSEIKNSSENENENENSNLANQSNSNENNATNSNLKNQTQNSEIKNSSENENESENSNLANESNSNENNATNSNLINQTQNSENKKESEIENENENGNLANQFNSNENNATNTNLKNQTQNSENKKENENENESENSNLANQSNLNEKNATNSNLKNQTQNSENKKESENENESENSNLANQYISNENNATNSNLKNQTQNSEKKNLNENESKNEIQSKFSNEYETSELPITDKSLSKLSKNELENQIYILSKEKENIIRELKTSYPNLSYQTENQLKFEIARLKNEQLKNLNKKNELTENLSVEKNKKVKLETQEKIDQLEKIERKIEASIKEANTELSKISQPTIALNFEEKVYEINEERKNNILSSDTYKNYVDAIVEFENENNRYLELDYKLITAQKRLNNQINQKALNQNDKNYTIEIESLVTQIEEIKKSRNNSYQNLQDKKKTIEEIERNNFDVKNEMQFLAFNRTEPLKKSQVYTDPIISSGGFEIKSNNNTPNLINQPIPINVKSPSGLVYRIQVGAFRKPLQQNVYSGFTPVSGELQSNGLTVYLAGYFNNSTKAVDAKKQIQLLGYSDAFVVAYCNGKKLTLGEARQLEARGECIPLGNNEFLVEISKNTQEALKEQKIAVANEQNINTTNDIEIKNLYFTVQIGVYNKPINEIQKFPGLKEISSNISPSKQIRYSTGKFADIETAKTRKNLAVSTGILDAFIVAYYQGERITISKANELISQYGKSILENENNLTNSSKIDNNETKLESYEKSFFADKVKEPEIRKIKYQIHDEFENFPKEKIDYFNNYGLFQYNASSKKMESIEFSEKNDINDIIKYSGFISRLEVGSNRNEKAQGFTLLNNQFDGDLVDFILRTNCIQSIETKKEISVILNSAILTEENYTNLLKNTFDLKIDTYEPK